MTLSTIDFLNLIAQTIFDKKGINILALDVRELSSLTDYFIIAEGLADKHVQAIADAILHELKANGLHASHVEGKDIGEWVVLDFFDIVIHLFAPGVREHYGLEELWHEASIVNVEIKVESER